MALIHIAGNTYELIIENRNGWNVEAFRNRYSEVLDRYDFIVGDWGYNQLRLKGFFRDGHQKATKDTTFSYMTDYINEYCNFGCAYFILEKKQGSEALETSDEDIFIEEIEYTRPVPTPKEPKESRDKSASVSAAEEGTGTNHKEQQSQRNNKRSAANRDKQGHDSEDGSGTHEKQRSRGQRQGSKQKHGHQDVASEANQESKQENKKDGKPKRKDFHRKGPRPFDKKGKGNKGQTDKVSTATTNE